LDLRFWIDEKTMNEESLFRVRNSFPHNLKSKIQNPKWVGIFAIVLTVVFGGVVAQAQQRPKVARIGTLRVDARTSPAAMESIDDLKRGLSNLGYVEGQNINFEIRRAENKLDRLPILAAELVQLKVDAIVTGGPQATKAAKEATNTIPIVMGRMDDVVEHGLVMSLARPGGNVTGLSFQTGELSGKWLELLKEVLPKLSRMAVLWDTSGTAGQLRTVEEGARSMGLHLVVSKVAGLKNFDFVFDGIRKERMEGLIILASPIFTGQRARLAELAAKQNLPAIYYHEGFAQAGGLLAYGPKQSEFSWHRAAIFVDKILKGAKPADLPVEQPTKFELVVNLKTAKQIGVTIPPSMLAQADKVIK
jgi:putative ABC transport system substrate-binding protein